MNVLVLGAKGFLGRHISRRFSDAGWTVSGLGNGDWYDHAAWGLSRWVQGPISAEELNLFSDSFECIVNCAGSGSVSFSFENPAQDFNRNAAATSVILEYIRVRQPQAHLICLSSAAVYGRIEALPIKEDAPLNPSSPYGVSKKMSEELCISYARHFQVTSTQLRLFSVYGPGLRKQLLWDAFHKLQLGNTTFFGTGQETRDWIYIEDVTSLVLKIAEQKLENGTMCILNGGTGIQTKNSEILEILARELGHESPIVFSAGSRAGDPDHYMADISKSESFGWTPMVTPEVGIRKYVEWLISTQ